MKKLPLTFGALTVTGMLGLGGAAHAADAPSVKQMLELKPTQRLVEIDTPTSDKLAGLKPEVVTEGKAKGWVLRDSGGRPIRKFMDMNKDNVVDLWIYYRDGAEAYRDIDSNHNGRADQFRWLNAAGTRWGVDSNEDGRIDGYRVISAEEATREFVRALVARDFSVVEPLLVRAGDAREAVGVVTPERAKELQTQAREQFAALAAKLTRLSAASQWLRFESGTPSLVPGDAADGSRDVTVYRGAMAVIETGNDSDVLRFGEIVQIGRAWKLTEMPTIVPPTRTMLARSSGATLANVLPTAETPEPEQPTNALQSLIAQLTSLDSETAKSGGPAAATAKYHLERADILEKIVGESPAGPDRVEWQRQLAESLVAALQIEASQDAADRLTRLAKIARDDENNPSLAGYVMFRRISADYTRAIQTPNADFDAIQKNWLEQLDRFVTDYPAADDTAEALSQLGVGMEFTGKDDQARQYYQKLVDTFPKGTAARRAAGAIRRLGMVGKPFEFQASDLRRGTINTRRLDGKVVLVDFWATNCDPWKNELPRLKEIYAKYRGKFEIVSVSVDGDKAEAMKFVQSAGVPWPIAFEPGGLDSAPALDYGIIALPTQFLIGPDGKVVSRSVHVSQLEEEIKKLLKSKD